MTIEEVQALLRSVGKTYSSLSEAEIDAILERAPDVAISADFSERALEAMRQSQAKREAGKR